MPKKNTISKKEPAKKEPTKRKRDKTFQTVRGMHDILPKEEAWWKTIFQKGHEISEIHDFYFIETPIVEHAAIFEAGVGAATDIVEKQMYVWRTKGGDKVALRPEGTSSLIRSYLQHHLGYFSSPLKAFHYGPMFRYEKPQSGRYRQFHQWDFDIIGDGDPFYDVQIILVLSNFLQSIGIKSMCLKINTVGCRVCRPSYRKKLLSYYRARKNKLCSDCIRRYEDNPLRLLDCKEENCKALKENAPIILDCLCQACNTHFKGVLELVEDTDLDYEPDPFLVRGLDYYNRTVFEIFATGSSDHALTGGGRYDYLSEALGGRLVPAVGGAVGLERVIEHMKEQKIDPKIKKKPGVFLVAVGEQAKKTGLCILNKLRLSGVRVLESIGKKSMSSQLKSADRSRAKLALILGQKECYEGTIITRNLETGAQETIPVERIVEEVKKRLK